MRTLARLTLVVGLVALMAGPALAQDKQGKGGRRGGAGQGKGGGRGMGGGMFGGQYLLANASVQTEIKVTDDQKTKITEYTTKEREEAAGRRGAGGEQPTPEQRAETAKKTAEARDKFAKETLKDDQYKRYSQIRLQNTGLSVFTEEKVVADLKLTGEQKDKIKSLNDDFVKDQRELMQGGFSPDTMTKATALRKEFMVKAEKVLTSDQQSKWKDLTGAPFEVKPDAGGGRGRRGQDKAQDK